MFKFSGGKYVLVGLYSHSSDGIIEVISYFMNVFLLSMFRVVVWFECVCHRCVHMHVLLSPPKKKNQPWPLPHVPSNVLFFIYYMYIVELTGVWYEFIYLLVVTLFPVQKLAVGHGEAMLIFNGILILWLGFQLWPCAVLQHLDLQE